MSKIKVNVYKVELCIIDFDEVGEEEIKYLIEDMRYPNHCMHPDVMKIEVKEVNWTDEHPLNKQNTCLEAYKKLFNIN